MSPFSDPLPKDEVINFGQIKAIFNIKHILFIFAGISFFFLVLKRPPTHTHIFGLLILVRLLLYRHFLFAISMEYPQDNVSPRNVHIVCIKKSKK